MQKTRGTYKHFRLANTQPNMPLTETNENPSAKISTKTHSREILRRSHIAIEHDFPTSRGNPMLILTRQEKRSEQRLQELVVSAIKT